MLNRTIVLAQVLVLFTGVILATPARSQAHTVFAGVPVVKVSEGGVERLPETLPREKAVNLGCVISEIGGKYYWATRDNKEMILRSGGSFHTFVAIDGSGYVRIVDVKSKSAAALMSSTEATFDYVEHVLLGLRSVTYYGKRR